MEHKETLPILVGMKTAETIPPGRLFWAFQIAQSTLNPNTSPRLQAYDVGLRGVLLLRMLQAGWDQVVD